MRTLVDNKFKSGLEAQKAGKLEQARQYYSAVLKDQPRHPDANHNMGVLKVVEGKEQESLGFFKNAIAENPKISQFWLSYIKVLIRLKLTKKAKTAYEKAKLAVTEGNSLTEVEKILFPDVRTLDLINLKLEILKKVKAIQSLQPSNQSISPDFRDPPKNELESLINFYEKQQFYEILKIINTLISDFSNSFHLHNILGATLLELKDPFNAVQAFRLAVHINPNSASIYNNLGNALRSMGKLEEAVSAYEKAVSLNPNFLDALNNLSLVLTDLCSYEEAIKCCKLVLALNSKKLDTYLNWGNALKKLGRVEEAITVYRAALQIRPNYAEALNNVGNALQMLGKFTEAAEVYSKALLNAPDFARAHRNLSQIKRYSLNDPQIATVQRLLSNKSINDPDKCRLHFTIAKMYEDIDEINLSFEHLSIGNAIRRKILGYSIYNDEHLFKRITETQPNICRISIEEKIPDYSPTPIFIIGMPRSGTTLVEQIISSHSMVQGAGELPFIAKFGMDLATGSVPINKQSILKFRQKYLSRIAELNLGKRFITDKMPQNFRFISLISTAFPEAKIIHVRRDAKATSWSNFKQYFPSNGLGYSYNLDDIASYYKLYCDLMSNGYSLNLNQIHTLEYEKLTNNHELETRKLIKFLGIGWDDACLSPQHNNRYVYTASVQQVRKPVYRGSSENWKRYERLIGDKFDDIAPIGT